MPNRIIKESICTSDEIDRLSAEQEVFFYRLMVVVDDFGLMDARPAILKAKCYPLKSIDIKCIQVMLNALSVIGLVRTYASDGKPYLQITNWAKHQQIRAKRAKYPEPNGSFDITCNQLISDAPVIQSNPIQSESNPNPIHAPSSRLSSIETPPKKFDPKQELIALDVTPEVANDFIAIRKKKGAPLTETALTGLKREAEKAGLSVNQALEKCCSRGWQGFEASWLQDHVSPPRKSAPIAENFAEKNYGKVSLL